MFGFYAESFYGTAPSDGLSRGCGDADMPQLVEVGHNKKCLSILMLTNKQ